jgi:nucleoside-diphosphate-sugar epimerase
MCLAFQNKYSLTSEREVCMANILLVGGTGAVGTVLSPLLEKEGHKVISLVRSKGEISPHERISGNVVAGDITLPDCGLSRLNIDALKGKIGKIVNSAACLKFRDVHAPEAEAVNVTGVTNLLHLADVLGVREFHQVSTAYIGGGRDRLGEGSIFPLEADGRNIYERTKARAECLVSEWQHGNHSIYRLGIVVGDSQTGHTSAFNGYYVFMSSLWYLKQALMVKLGELGNDGVYFDGEDLILPIQIGFSEESTLNLVPVDWACRMLSRLIGLETSGKVFHLVDPEPKRICWINDVSLQQCLGIRGYSYGTLAESRESTLLARLQRIFDRATAQYEPYVTHECRFETGNVEATLGLRYEQFPKMTEALIMRLLNYAKSKSVNFGRKEK